MEEKKRFKAGVSALIGVILMVAIVVAIAATIVAWVIDIESTMHASNEKKGWVVSADNRSVLLTDFGTYQNWSIALSSDQQGNQLSSVTSFLFEINNATGNNTVYLNAVPPQIGQHVTITYATEHGYLIAKKVQVIS